MTGSRIAASQKVPRAGELNERLLAACDGNVEQALAVRRLLLGVLAKARLADPTARGAFVCRDPEGEWIAEQRRLARR